MKQYIAPSKAFVRASKWLVCFLIIYQIRNVAERLDTYSPRSCRSCRGEHNLSPAIPPQQQEIIDKFYLWNVKL